MAGHWLLTSGMVHSEEAGVAIWGPSRELSWGERWGEGSVGSHGQVERRSDGTGVT